MNVLSVVGETNSQGASLTRYQGIWGSADANVTTEARSKMQARSAGTLSNLWTYVVSNSRSDTTTYRVRVNAVNGNSLLSITTGATGAQEDVTNTDSIDDTEEFGVSLATPAGTGTIVTTGIVHVFAPTSGTVAYFGRVGDGITATADTAIAMTAHSVGASLTGSTEANVQNTIGFSATLQHLWVNVDANTRTDTTVIRSRVNGVNGNMVASYATTITGEVLDTTNTDSIAAGDEVSFLFDQNAGTGSLRPRGTVIEIAATDAFPFFSSQAAVGTATTQAAGVTRYLWPGGNLTSEFLTNEVEAQVDANVGFTWSYLVGYVSQYSLDTGNYVVRSRVGGANGNQVITFTGTGQQADVTNTDTVSVGSLIAYSSVTGGATGTVTLHTVSTAAAAAGGGPTVKPWYAYAQQ